MGDFGDRQKLLALTGDQECSCCGREPIMPEDVEVIDGEVVCLDCSDAYFPQVMARRRVEA